MSKLTNREQAKLVMVALDAGLRGDGKTFNESLDTIAEDGGWPALFGVACAFAAAILKTSPNLTEGDGPLGIEVEHIATGQSASIEQTGMPADLIAATRILVAHGNDDTTAAHDIWVAAVNGGYGQDTVAAMAALAIRHLAEHPKYREVYGDKLDPMFRDRP